MPAAISLWPQVPLRICGQLTWDPQRNIGNGWRDGHGIDPRIWSDSWWPCPHHRNICKCTIWASPIYDKCWHGRCDHKTVPNLGFDGKDTASSPSIATTNNQRDTTVAQTITVVAQDLITTKLDLEFTAHLVLFFLATGLDNGVKYRSVIPPCMTDPLSVYRVSPLPVVHIAGFLVHSFYGFLGLRSVLHL